MFSLIQKQKNIKFNYIDMPFFEVINCPKQKILIIHSAEQQIGKQAFLLRIKFTQPLQRTICQHLAKTIHITYMKYLTKEYTLLT